MAINIGQAHHQNSGEAFVNSAGKAMQMFAAGEEMAAKRRERAKQEEMLAKQKAIDEGGVEELDFDTARAALSQYHDAEREAELKAYREAHNALDAPVKDALTEVDGQIAQRLDVPNTPGDAAQYKTDLDSAKTDLSAQVADRAATVKTGEQELLARHEQNKADALATVQGGKKFRFNGRDITEEQAKDIDRYKAEQTDAMYRGYGVKSNRLSEMTAQRAADMQMGEAQNTIKIKREMNDDISKRRGIDEMQGRIRSAGGIDAFLSQSGVPPEQMDKTREVLRRDFGPTVGYSMDLRRASRLEELGHFGEAEKVKDRANSAAAIDALGAIYRSNGDPAAGKEAAALYNLFPNGDTISGVQFTPGNDPKDPMKGAVVQITGSDGKPRKPMGIDQVEDYLLGQADPKYTADLIKQRRTQDGKMDQLYARFNSVLDRMGRTGGGAHATSRGTGSSEPAASKKKQAGEDFLGWLEDNKKVSDVAVPDDVKFRAADAFGANPGLWKTQFGKQAALEAVQGVASGSLQPRAQLHDDGTFDLAVTLPKTGQVVRLATSYGGEGIDPLAVKTGAITQEEMDRQVVGLLTKTGRVDRTGVPVDRAGFDARVNVAKEKIERAKKNGIDTSELESDLAKEVRLNGLTQQYEVRRQDVKHSDAQKKPVEKPSQTSSTRSIGETGRLSFLENAGAYRQLTGAEKNELEELRRKAPLFSGVKEVLRGRADAESSQMIPPG